MGVLFYLSLKDNTSDHPSGVLYVEVMVDKIQFIISNLTNKYLCTLIKSTQSRYDESSLDNILINVWNIV